jgi:hypothetical protein
MRRKEKKEEAQKRQECTWQADVAILAYPELSTGDRIK